MRIFISGVQDRQFILDTLNDLHNNYGGIKEILGVLSTECMQHIIRWAEKRSIDLNMYIPDGFSERDIMNTNTRLIKKEKPDVVLVYSENREVKKQLTIDAQESPSVQFLIREYP